MPARRSSSAAASSRADQLVQLVSVLGGPLDLELVGQRLILRRRRQLASGELPIVAEDQVTT